MSNLQKWLLIGAVWLIAISLFLIGLQRYLPTSSTNAVVDRWTGEIK